ncbi:MAG: hypothetical protein KAS73_03130 [Candidatus Sabulitectum sp.]|nr:hypothetical protein [Candidatus Sabulitectum sp.]
MLKFLLAVLFSTLVFATAPDFLTGQRINATGGQIDVICSDAAVADWNGDGKKDLVLGVYSWGRLRLYTNTGSDSSPQFGSYSNLQADNTAIALGYG